MPAAARLWDDGHRREAVQAAASAVDIAANAKASSQLTGMKLFEHLFSTEDPKPGQGRLRFVEIDRTADKNTWVNQHVGALRISAGAMQLIRNTTTHLLEAEDDRT